MENNKITIIEDRIDRVKQSLTDPEGNQGIMAYNDGKLMALFQLGLINIEEYSKLTKKHGLDSEWGKSDDT